MNNIKQLVRNAVTFCCLVNNFSTIFRLAPPGHDLGIVKQGTNKIGNAHLPLSSPQLG
jgi:hypothetical protein